METPATDVDHGNKICKTVNKQSTARIYRCFPRISALIVAGQVSIRVKFPRPLQPIYNSIKQDNNN